MARLSEQEILSILDRWVNASQPDQQLSDNRRRAMDYFYGRPRGDEVAGRSQVMSLDIADTVESLKAQLLPSFCGDAICSFEPVSPEDELQARIETDATNRAIMESGRGYVAISEAIQDALLLKCGVIKGWIEEVDGNRRLRLQAVDPLCFGVDAGHDSVLLDDCRMVWERKRYTRQELIDMGLPEDKVGRLPVWEGPHYETGIRSRDYGSQIRERLTEATEIVEICETHARLDCDGEGKVGLYRFLHGEGVLLLKEEVSFIPYAAGVAWLEPHSFYGLSVYDKLKQVQDIKTALTRQMVDNLAACNFPRTAVNDRVDLESFLRPRPSGAVLVEGSGPVQEALQPLPVLSSAAESQAALQYFDKVRAERTGASLDLQTADRQLLNSQIGAANVAMILGASELQAASVARTIGETLIRSLFLLTHRLLRLEYGRPILVRVVDQWLPVQPSTWRPRDRINLKAGLAPIERTRKAAVLQSLVTMQVELARMGLDGVLVDAGGFHRAVTDWAIASGIDAPERYLLDPQSAQAAAAARSKAEAGRQAQALQEEMQRALLAIEAQRVEIEKLKVRLEAQNDAAELRFRYADAALRAEIEEAKLVGQATIDLARQQRELAARSAGGSEGVAAGSGGSGNGADGG